MGLLVIACMHGKLRAAQQSVPVQAAFQCRRISKWGNLGVGLQEMLGTNPHPLPTRGHKHTLKSEGVSLHSKPLRSGRPS